MSTDKEFANSVLFRLGLDNFTIKPMFSEYCLYYDGKPVGFVCDNRVLIKPTKESAHLAKICEAQSAYPGSKLYYFVSDEQLKEPSGFIETMQRIAANAPAKKPKKKS